MKQIIPINIVTLWLVLSILLITVSSASHISKRPSSSSLLTSKPFRKLMNENKTNKSVSRRAKPQPSTKECSSINKNSQCQATAGCEVIQERVCHPILRRKCKTFRYGCQSSGSFCEFNQGDKTAQQYQCSLHSECSWNTTTSSCSLANTVSNSGTSFPTVYPTSPPTLYDGFKNSYSIDLRFTKNSRKVDIDFDIKDYFLGAVERWQTIIESDINSTYVMKKGTVCHFSSIIADEDIVVDDLLIFIDVIDIDGPSGMLARAGPCILTNDNGVFSRVGLIQFDIADLLVLKNSLMLEDAIIHEMGHVIGIGTLWNSYELLSSAKPKSKSGLFYLGGGGQNGLEGVGGNGYPKIETDGGVGTAGSHFDEKTYGDELMTGWLDPDSKLSKMSIKSLEDIGLSVRAEYADDYIVPQNRKEQVNPGLRGGKKSHPMVQDTLDMSNIIIDKSTPYHHN